MSLQIGKVRNIPIRLHFTLILAFFLITWSISTGFMPYYYPTLDPLNYWIMGSLGSLILFVSVLLHELSHSIVAKKFGIQVKQILLFIFGGVADIEEEPKEFSKEFKIAFAGPVASFALSSLFALLWGLTSLLGWFALEHPFLPALLVANGIFLYAAILNLVLGLFNLIPAFPMDGGRILRSILVRKKKSYDQATRISVRLGIIISYIFFGLGFLIILSGSFVGGMWILLIGWFLQNGAQSYIYQYDVMQVLSRIKIKDIMKPNVISVNENLAIDNVLTNYFNVYMKSAFPVVDDGGRFVGTIPLKTLFLVPEQKRHMTVVRDIMIDKKNTVYMDMDDTAEQALANMIKKHIDKIYICNAEGIPIGVVSKTDILEASDDLKMLIRETNRSSMANNK
ncbi:MAG: site-2 protease family protein [Thermoproteota archaeon]|nr:site-2 protease family protein [Thermoproteota archaeon]